MALGPMYSAGVFGVLFHYEIISCERDFSRHI